MTQPTPQIAHYGFLDCQVCVPKEWTDAEVLEYVEKEFPSGTQNGWFIRGPGHELLNGAPYRVPCSDRSGCTHIMLEV